MSTKKYLEIRLLQPELDFNVKSGQTESDHQRIGQEQILVEARTVAEGGVIIATRCRLRASLLLVHRIARLKIYDAGLHHSSWQAIHAIDSL